MEAAPPVTVITTRFEDLVSRGLRALIEDDAHLELLESDVDLDALGPAIERTGPQVALLNFGSLRGAVEVHELHTAHPATRLLVLGNRPSAAESNQMLALGATACLSKSTEARDILSAIHLASRGIHVLPPTPDQAPAEAPNLLTAREADVLDLLRSGFSNGEIAMTLHVGVETVRTHARHIYRKLGVKTRRDVASAGRAAGRTPAAP